MSSSPFCPGTLLAGRYRIVRSLGSGGMGHVYQVEDTALENELVALKLLKGEGPENTEMNATARFRNEVLVTRRLAHANIVRTFDFGVVEGRRTFMTMEYVSGQTLEELIKEGTFFCAGINATLRVLIAVAEAVEHAHRKGVIHRDLKSANVMLSDEGQVKVTDFGLAQVQGFERNLTMKGECVGTPTYMSPEQVQGAHVDHRCDIYSFGVIAYELVAGRVPFRDPSWMTLASKIVNEPLPPITSSLYEIPPWYIAMVHKAAAKDPDDRFQSFSELLTELRSHLPVTPAKSEPLAGGTVRIVIQRVENMWTPRIVAGAALAFLLLAAGVAGVLR